MGLEGRLLMRNILENKRTLEGWFGRLHYVNFEIKIGN